MSPFLQLIRAHRHHNPESKISGYHLNYIFRYFEIIEFEYVDAAKGTGCSQMLAAVGDGITLDFKIVRNLVSRHSAWV